MDCPSGKERFYQIVWKTKYISAYLADSVAKSLKEQLGKDIKIEPSPEFKKRLYEATEKDIVQAGLAYTMYMTATVKTDSTTYKYLFTFYILILWCLLGINKNY